MPDVRGWEQVQANINAAIARARVGLKAGLYQEGEAIMTASKRIVPVETGALRASGFVEPPTDDLVVTLGYGGPATPYALKQHEETGYKHKAPGQAKYLEQPAREATAGMPERIGARVRSFVEAA